MGLNSKPWARRSGGLSPAQFRTDSKCHEPRPTYSTVPAKDHGTNATANANTSMSRGTTSSFLQPGKIGEAGFRAFVSPSTDGSSTIMAPPQPRPTTPSPPKKARSSPEGCAIADLLGAAQMIAQRDSVVPGKKTPSQRSVSATPVESRATPYSQQQHKDPRASPSVQNQQVEPRASPYRASPYHPSPYAYYHPHDPRCATPYQMDPRTQSPYVQDFRASPPTPLQQQPHPHPTYPHPAAASAHAHPHGHGHHPYVPVHHAYPPHLHGHGTAPPHMHPQGGAVDPRGSPLDMEQFRSSSRPTPTSFRMSPEMSISHEQPHFVPINTNVVGNAAPVPIRPNAKKTVTSTATTAKAGTVSEGAPTAAEAPPAPPAGEKQAAALVSAVSFAPATDTFPLATSSGLNSISPFNESGFRTKTPTSDLARSKTPISAAHLRSKTPTTPGPATVAPTPTPTQQSVYGVRDMAPTPSPMPMSHMPSMHPMGLGRDVAIPTPTPTKKDKAAATAAALPSSSSSSTDSSTSTNRKATRTPSPASLESVQRIVEDKDLNKRLLLSMAMGSRERSKSPTNSLVGRSSTPIPTPSSVISDGFFWKDYPVLEGILYSHMTEYYELSINRRQSKDQQQFNNNLVEMIRAKANQNGWTFDANVFDDKKIRDRIRCFFKTHIQNAKKRLNTMLKKPDRYALQIQDLVSSVEIRGGADSSGSTSKIDNASASSSATGRSTPSTGLGGVTKVSAVVAGGRAITPPSGHKRQLSVTPL